MFAKSADAHCTLVDSLHEGRGGRDLIQRVVRDLEVLRERLADDMRQWLVGALGNGLAKGPRRLSIMCISVRA